MSKTQIALLKKYGLSIRGFRGQHLLIDPNIQRKIVELVDPRPRERILEIGPGLGALTAELLAAGGEVIAVEEDRRFCEILEGELGGDYKGKFRVMNEDILKTDLQSLRGGRRPTKQSTSPQIAPQGLSRSSKRNIMEGIASGASRLRNDSGGKIKIVSNLPYYITTPVIFWLIENRAWVERAVLMMQREVADRILAQPGNKDYGRLTVAIRYYADVHRAFNVSRNCFTPRPEVDSSVVTLDFYLPSKFPKGINETLLFYIVKIAFGARRKTLVHQLACDATLGKSRKELKALFNQMGISEKARAEDLLLKDFMALAVLLGRDG